MPTNSQDVVSREALFRSKHVPGVWAATFNLDEWCWVNQESGWRDVAAVMPGWDDVQAMIVEGLEK